MKKGILLGLSVVFVTMLSLLVVVGCGSKGIEYVTISNKAELTAEWVVGDADRTVKIEINPSTEAVADEEISIVSDNTSVVSVTGKTLQAVGAGTAVITVTVQEKSDNVSITVSALQVQSVSIENKEALTEKWYLYGEDREVSVKLSPGSFNLENTEVTLSSNSDAVEVDGMILKAKAVGHAVITAAAGDLTDTVEVTVSDLDAPSITIEGETTFSGLAGESIVLPEATAKTCYGADITNAIEITEKTDSISVSDGIFVAPEAGTYELVYTVADPKDGSKISSQAVTINVYRKVLSWDDGSFFVENELDADAEQVVRSTSSGAVIAQFNLAPGKVYYAEAVFTISGETNPVNLGMVHFSEGNTNRFLGTIMDRGDKNLKTKDIDITDGWQDSTLVDGGPFSWQIAGYRGLKDDDAATVKYAVARNGSYFYVFVNDQYVNTVTYTYYRNRNTVPGIIGIALNDTVISDVQYYAGAAAQEKIETLLGADTGYDNMFSPYIPYIGNRFSQNSLNDNNKNYTVNPYSETRGINFDFTNNSCDWDGGNVSPYIYFDGDFTFEWEYKMTSGSDLTQESRMILEVGPWNNFDESATVLQFGTDFIQSNTRSLLNVPNFPEEQKWNEIGGEFDRSAGERFTLTRTLTDTCAIYIMTITSIANPQQVHQRTIEWSGDKWNEQVILHWKNKKVAGEFSNIKWSLGDSSVG